MTTNNDDTLTPHTNLLKNDPVYKQAWEEKKIEISEKWASGRSHEDRLKDAGKSVFETGAAGEVLREKKVEDFRLRNIAHEADQFHKDYQQNPQAVLDDLEKKRLERQQGQALSQTPENAPVLDKAQIAEAGLEKTAAAQQGQSRDYSALKTEIPSPERGFDRTTKEGRDAYREQLKSHERSEGQEITQRDYSKVEDRDAFRKNFAELQKEKEQEIKRERELQEYGEKRGNDRHYYGSLKTGRTRDDDRER